MKRDQIRTNSRHLPSAPRTFCTPEKDKAPALERVEGGGERSLDFYFRSAGHTGERRGLSLSYIDTR